VKRLKNRQSTSDSKAQSGELSRRDESHSLSMKNLLEQVALNKRGIHVPIFEKVLAKGHFVFFLMEALLLP
jgi:hypothetical protein